MLLHHALSRFIGTQSGSRTYIRPLLQVAAGVAGERLTQSDPLDVLKRLGMTAADLDDEWVVARANGQLLSRELVEALVPPEVWPWLRVLVELGPVAGWERTESVLRAWARGVEPDGQPRERGRLALASIELLTAAYHRLARELCELRRLAKASVVPLDERLLAQWLPEDVPMRVRGAQLGAIPANRDRRAPSLRAARLALRAAHHDVEWRRKRSSHRRSLRRFLRNRALLAVFLVTGGRLTAIMQLRRGDFIRFHRSGGLEGPALLFRPGKTVQRELVRAKFVPDLVGDWIQEWLDYAGHNDEPDAPLWLATRATGRVPLDATSAYQMIVDAFRPFVAERVCSPHTLRHLAEKLAFQSGIDWLAENRERLLTDESLSGMPSSPQTFADVLLDHALGTVQDRYKDIASEHGRETWSRIAAEGIWQLVWGEKGAPRGPDIERVRVSAEAVCEHEEKVAALRRQLERAEAEKDVVRQRGGDDSLDVKSLVQLFFRLDAAADEIAGASSALAHAEEELSSARAELAAALGARVPVSDAADIPALEREVAALAERPVTSSRGQTSDGSSDEVLPRRTMLTAREFHWALGGADAISEPTLRRYLRGDLPYPAGDRRNLWEPPVVKGQLPDCVHRPSPRKTFVRVDRLDLTRFSSYVIERLRYLQALGEGEIFAEAELAA